MVDLYYEVHLEGFLFVCDLNVFTELVVPTVINDNRKEARRE